MTRDRIATVRATGRRYLVAGVFDVERGAPKVILRGEVVGFDQQGSRVTSVRTEAPFNLPIAEVALEPTTLTPALLRGLFLQRAQVLREAGRRVEVRTTRSGGLVLEDFGTPEEERARDERRAKLLDVRRRAEEALDKGDVAGFNAVLEDVVAETARRPS
jgi:hypothetical protein